MITKNILNFVITFFGNIISLFNLPALPTDALQSAKDYISMILENVSLLGLAVRPVTLKAAAGVLMALMIFKFAYPKLRFLISKLPFIKK